MSFENLSRSECHAYVAMVLKMGVGNAQKCLKTDGLDKGTGDLKVHVYYYEFNVMNSAAVSHCTLHILDGVDYLIK